MLKYFAQFLSHSDINKNPVQYKASCYLECLLRDAVKDRYHRAQCHLDLEEKLKAEGCTEASYL